MQDPPWMPGSTSCYCLLPCKSPCKCQLPDPVAACYHARAKRTCDPPRRLSLHVGHARAMRICEPPRHLADHARAMRTWEPPGRLVDHAGAKHTCEPPRHPVSHARAELTCEPPRRRWCPCGLYHRSCSLWPDHKRELCLAEGSRLS